MKPEEKKTAAQRIAEEAEKGRVTLEKANAEATDWRAWCRKCGKQVVGTLADLQAHRC